MTTLLLLTYLFLQIVHLAYIIYKGFLIIILFILFIAFNNYYLINILIKLLSTLLVRLYLTFKLIITNSKLFFYY
jgi:hypothetical protein